MLQHYEPLVADPNPRIAEILRRIAPPVVVQPAHEFEEDSR